MRYAPCAYGASTGAGVKAYALADIKMSNELLEPQQNDLRR